MDETQRAHSHEELDHRVEGLRDPPGARRPSFGRDGLLRYSLNGCESTDATQSRSQVEPVVPVSKARWTLLWRWEDGHRVTIYEPLRPSAVKILRKKGWKLL